MNKIFFIICAIVSTVSGFSFEAEETKMNQQFVEQIFRDVIEDMDADEKIISKYFSPSYMQNVDGHILDYKEFVHHMRVQKTILESAKVTLDHFAIEGNKMCTVHRVDAIKRNGEKIAVKVIAYYEIDQGKIVFCNELTHLIKGELEDQNIGSIR